MISLRRKPADRPTRRHRGAVIPIVAGGAAALIAATAFTIDLGRLMIRNREMQEIADIAAIEAARELNGSTVAVVRPAVLDAVDEAAARNGESGASFDVLLGTYDPYRREFMAAASDSDVPNAVRVKPTSEVDFMFAPGSRTAGRHAVALQPGVVPNPPPPPPPVTTTSTSSTSSTSSSTTATTAPTTSTTVPDPFCIPPNCDVKQTAGFTLGSFLLGLDSNDSTILNALLGGLPGSPSFSLNAVAWQGIGAGRVDVDALAAELGFATPYDLANANVDVQDLIQAMAVVGDMNADSRAHLNNIAASINAGTTIDMGDLMLVTTGGNSAAAMSHVSIAGLLTGSAIVADGDHAIAVPGLSFGISGITATQLELTFIERPQSAWGEEGTSASTRQATLTIRNTVNIPLVPPVGVTSVSLVGDVVVAVNNLPPPNGVAGATATLNHISCAGTEGIILDVATRAIGSGATVTASLVAQTALGNIDEPIGLTGTVVTPPATGQVDFVYQNQFFMDPYWFGPKRFGSHTVGLSGLQLSYTDGIGSAVLAPLTNSVTDTVLEPLLGLVDTWVVGSVSPLLGLGFGGADIWANGMNCFEPILVPSP